jgi:hypothetical protein
MVYKIFEEYKRLIKFILKEELNYFTRIVINIKINDNIVTYEINDLELKIKIIDIIKHQDNKIKFLKLLLTKNNIIKKLIN